MTPVLEIVAPGLMATIQDLGRMGHQAQGMPTSGALDMGNLRLANQIVGNAQGMGALEFRIMGPTIRVLADSVRVALTGTTGSIELLGETPQSFASNRSVTFRRGETFRIGAIADSAVCYLAVEGGFDVPALYDSQSTYLAGGFGGFAGRVLAAGDRLPLRKEAPEVRPEAICTAPFSYRTGEAVRVVPGPQSDYFTKEGLATFLSSDYVLTPDSNRMGAQLDGAVIAHAKGANINSDGIVTGAIQVPGNGLPIILLADHQTTGGYPKIAVVASADISRIGRMKPGERLRFQAVSVAEAEEARERLEAKIAAAVASIALLPGEGDLLAHMLAHSNLVSGVHSEE